MPTIKSPRTTDLGASTVDFRDTAVISRYTAAVSLHAHTNRSREGMSFVGPYLDRIPMVGPLAKREMRAYERRHGRQIDFAEGWWHPPVQPSEVWESERAQIERRLGLRAFVSISDHDSVDACVDLQAQLAEPVPISFEWTVPYGSGFVHVGVHNMPPDESRSLFEALNVYTREPTPASLRRLLDHVHASPDTLVVLNHPMWDLAGLGPAQHASMIRTFLLEHGRRIHALELNGYRAAAENRQTTALASALDLPLVSGGDRHGRAPNALLNLTVASTFGEFVREIRQLRRSSILVMPEYRHSLVSRKLAVAGDAVRSYPSSPHGQQLWTDRVSYERDGVIRQLSQQWPTGGPFWVRSAVTAFERATHRPFRPALRFLVWVAGASLSTKTSTETSPEPVGTPTVARTAGDRVHG